MRSLSRRLAILCVWAAGFLGVTAKAVCFKGDVSVDPVTNGPVLSWEKEFQQSLLVVIGTAISAKNLPDPQSPDFWLGTLYKLKVEARLKGSAGPSIDVFSSNDSGRLPLKRAVRYVLFLYQDNGRLMADPCGNSAKLVSPFR